MIFDQLGIKKHRIIIDMTNNFLVFWPDYYIYIRAISLIILCSLSLPTKIAVDKRSSHTLKANKKSSKKI